ncbi:MAG: TlpA family protein disulfide reductase [Gammaproteobacteria bacterium]|nr:MAG: TlpA family protein disulfide reductase [Gammaproteobacteria bacterium]
MSPALLRIVRLGAFGLVFALAGFWAGQRWLDARQPPPAMAPSASTALVDRLPDIRLPDLDGRPRSLDEWAGRTLLLNFWATWCAPCREEMPLLQRLHEERSERGMAVVGIAVDRLPAVRRYIAESGIAYPQLVGEEDAMAAAEAFGPPFVGLPFTVFVGPGGEVLGLRRGAIDRDELAAIVRALDAYAGGSAGLAETRAALAD